MTSPADAAELPASIVSHVSIGTDDLDRAVAFHEAVLATLGIGIVERIGDVAVAFGRAFPEFWVQVPANEAPASVGNGTHVAFVAASRAEVDAFHEAALAAGATDEGAPGPRPHTRLEVTPGMPFPVPIASAKTLEGQDIQFGVRPEDLRIAEGAQFLFEGTVSFVESLGEVTLLHISVERAPELVVAKIAGIADYEKGQRVRVIADEDKLHMFDAAGLTLRGKA